jgi:hypothetical protein
MKSETTGEIILASYRELRRETMDAVSTTPENKSHSALSSPIKEKRRKYQILGRSKYQLFVPIAVAAAAVIIVLALVINPCLTSNVSNPCPTITKPSIITPAPTTTKAMTTTHYSLRLIISFFSISLAMSSLGKMTCQLSIPTSLPLYGLKK